MTSSAMGSSVASKPWRRWWDNRRRTEGFASQDPHQRPGPARDRPVPVLQSRDRLGVRLRGLSHLQNAPRRQDRRSAVSQEHEMSSPRTSTGSSIASRATRHSVGSRRSGLRRDGRRRSAGALWRNRVCTRSLVSAKSRRHSSPAAFRDRCARTAQMAHSRRPVGGPHSRALRWVVPLLLVRPPVVGSPGRPFRLRRKASVRPCPAVSRRAACACRLNHDVSASRRRRVRCLREEHARRPDARGARASSRVGPRSHASVRSCG